MIVMNAMSVWVRTSSVIGCRTSVARPDSMACAVDGASAREVAIPTTWSRADASPSWRASTSARTLPAATISAITSTCSAIAWPASERGQATRNRRIVAHTLR